MPGLWDMHVHLSWTKASALPALVANGVTGVRDMGGLLREIDEWRVRIVSGVMVGPRILRSGPVLNGRQFAFQQFAVVNESEARGAVRALHKAGVDCIKVHRAISREAYLGAVDECRSSGFRWWVIPNTIAPLEASTRGTPAWSMWEHSSTAPLPRIIETSRLPRPCPIHARIRRESVCPVCEQRHGLHSTLVSHRMAMQFGRAKPNERDKYVSRPRKNSGGPPGA
jgi:hypothetical protein